MSADNSGMQGEPEAGARSQVSSSSEYLTTPLMLTAIPGGVGPTAAPRYRDGTVTQLKLQVAGASKFLKLAGPFPVTATPLALTRSRPGAVPVALASKRTHILTHLKPSQ